MNDHTKLSDLVSRRNSLLEELNQVTRAIEDEQTHVFKHIASEKVLVQRYFDGDRIVISFGRYWWINEDGDLLAMVDESDIDELKTLTEKGVFSRVVINS